MIALHEHLVAAGAEHGAALVALPYLPVAVVAFLVYVEVAARLGVPGARAYRAAYERAGRPVKLAALLMAVSATVHLALAPGHAAEPVTAALFVLDAAALAALGIGGFVLPLRRPLTAGVLAAGLAAYAVCLLAGLESPDAVGAGTKLVEGIALWLVAGRRAEFSVPMGKEVLDPMSPSRIYAVAFGVVYTIVGLIGFAVSSSLDTANLVVFPVNVLHNAVHLLVGLAGIAAFLTARSVLYARVMAVVFAVLTVAGFLPQPLLGLVPIGGPDIVLHALTAILAGAAGWAYASDGVRAATT